MMRRNLHQSSRIDLSSVALSLRTARTSAPVWSSTFSRHSCSFCGALSHRFSGIVISFGNDCLQSPKSTDIRQITRVENRICQWRQGQGCWPFFHSHCQPSVLLRLLDCIYKSIANQPKMHAYKVLALGLPLGIVAGTSKVTLLHTGMTLTSKCCDSMSSLA